MGELNDLYKEVIFDHNKSPRNFREMPDATCAAGGHNPLCGDKVSLYIKIKDGVIEDVSFQGKGCAISTASASLMTTQLKGKKVEEANDLFRRFVDMLTGDPSAEATDDGLGKLMVFSGVREFPVRVKCATLAWHTLENALRGKDAVAKTE